MIDVFVSYKREDEARVAALVEGLRRSGLHVWWDRDIPAGAPWRQTLLEQLEKARCVVVVWSVASAGPAGEFVHEEAARARDRGVYLPVRIDRIREPLGFGEIQSLDLAGWRGRVPDRRFQDLADAAKAMVAGSPRPRPRAVRRWSVATAGASLAVFTAALGLWADVAGLQGTLCRLPVLNGICERAGWGGLPSPEEAALWQGRLPGDCQGLRQYLGRYPTGVWAEEAQRRLQAVLRVDRETWSREEVRFPLTVRAHLDPSPDEDLAQRDAAGRGEEEARVLCSGFKGGEFRLESATSVVSSWRCSPRAGGIVCGFDGQAVCTVHARHVAPSESCP